MQRRSHGSSLLLAGILGLASAAMAQSSAMPDAQVEANVLRALAGSPQLATQSIKTTTVYGTVTLSGTVADETSRTLAETLASRAPGVTKVVDQLTLTSDSDANAAPGTDGSAAPAQSAQGSNPQLQSDGTMAPADAGQQDPNQGGQPSGQGQGQNQAPEPGYVSPPAPPAGQPQNSQQNPNGGNQSSATPVYRQPYPGPQQGYPQQNTQGYPPQGYPRQGYPQQGYAQGQAPPAYGSQVAGKPVTIASGAMLRVRLNEGLSSKRVQPGEVFDATVLNDVVADGEIAIPRGAAVQGTIVVAKDSGAVGGKGALSLQLTSVTLSGNQFPIASDVWTHDGPNNTGRTVSNAVGLGAFGAIIGAVAGGGPGAAIGAVAGGAAGVGVSAAQGGGRVIVPAEAILTFHLAQPAGVTTVSEAEIERLGYGVQQGQMVRRPPPPPPGYYYPRPAYYPYPY